MPSENESEGRTYSEYMGSARNARRHGTDERRHEKTREYESSDENERRNERKDERRDRRNDRRDKRDERNERDREIDKDIRFRENKLRIPTFHGKSDVEAYLD